MTKRIFVQLAVIASVFLLRAYLPAPLKHVFDVVLGIAFVVHALLGGIRGVKDYRDERMMAAGRILFAIGAATWTWATEIAQVHHEIVVVTGAAMCVGAAMILDLNERRNTDGSPRVALTPPD